MLAALWDEPEVFHDATVIIACFTVQTTQTYSFQPQLQVSVNNRW